MIITGKRRRSLSYLYPWQHRVCIDNKQNSSDLEDYQVKVSITDSGMIAKMKEDGGDIRFYVGTTKISYWIEEKTSSKLVVWVKVPLIPGSSTTRIYMYYGNPSASSESNGEAVFEFFDDFEDGDISDWTIGGSNSNRVTDVSTEDAYKGSRSLHLRVDGSNAPGIDAWVEHTLPNMTNFAVKFHYKDVNGDNMHVVISDTSISGGWPANRFHHSYASPNQAGSEDNVAWKWVKDGTSYEAWRQDTSPTGWHSAEIRHCGTTTKFYYDGELKATETTMEIEAKYLAWADDWPNEHYDQYFDLVYVRKYTDPEPTVTIES